MMLLQKRRHRFGRPADGGAPARHDDGPLQQDRMRGDHLGDLRFAEIGLLLAERLELRFAIPNQILRIAAQKVDQFFDFVLARRLLEILADRGLYSLAAQKLERLPRFAAARVVPDRDAHLDPLSMSPPSYGGGSVRGKQDAYSSSSASGLGASITFLATS